MEDKGGLPTHPLLEALLNDRAYRKSLGRVEVQRVEGATPLWSGDLYAHPAEGATFRKNRDIKDAKSGWRLPWRDAVAAVGDADLLLRPKTGLLVTPAEVEGKSKITIHPKSIHIVHPVVEHFGGTGKLDPKTGMVLEAEAQSEKEKRRLYRISDAGLGPLVRYVNDFYGRRGVRANDWPGNAFGVAYVVYDVLDAQGRMRLAGLTLEQVQALSDPQLLRALGGLGLAMQNAQAGR